MSRESYNYKRHALIAARELRYPQKFIERIENATTENEIRRIMTTARNEMRD